MSTVLNGLHQLCTNRHGAVFRELLEELESFEKDGGCSERVRFDYT
jgi:hypothetical protein